MTQPCGCCATPAAAAATHPGNRPWLSAIDYRLGTFGTFREAILDELAGTPELAGLRSRVSDDYSIAAVEMWAAVADVLSFYTERVANEAFLRTATLRDSVLRLVRVLDYQLAPGAAATTAIAFTLEKGASALIPVGTRIQSVPGEGETPQKYETLESVRAGAHLNSLRLFPAPAVGAPLSGGSTHAIAAPDAPAVAAVAGLAPGQKVIVFAPNAAEILTVEAATAADDGLTVTWRDPIDGAVFAPNAADGNDASTGAFRLGRTFRVYGVDAPARVVVPGRKVAGDPTTTFLAEAATSFAFGTAPVTTLALDARYPGLKTGASLLVVAGSEPPVTGVCAVTSVGEGQAVRTASYVDPITTLPVETTAVTGSVTIVGVTGADFLAGLDVRDVAIHELLGDPLRFWQYEHPDVVATNTAYVSGRRAGWSSIEVGRAIERGRYTSGSVLDTAELPAGRRVIALDARGGTPVPGTVLAATLVGQDVAFTPAASDAATLVTLALDPGHAAAQTVLVSEELSWPRGFQGTALELAVTIGALPTQTITMAPTYPDGTMNWIDDLAASLQDAIRAAVPGAPTFAQAMAWADGGAIVVAAGVPGDPIRFGPSERDAQTVAFLGIDPLRARFFDGVLSGPTAALVGTSVNGWVGVRRGIDPTLEKNLVAGPILDVPALAGAISAAFGVWGQPRPDGRILFIPPIPLREPRSFLRLDLDADVPLALDTATAVLLGNVARASHGETIRNEVMGNGDGSAVFQRFPLRKSPVTYVPASVPGGIASSLQVLVNGALWTEVPTLYGADPTAEVYTTRLADDGVRTLLTGDGVSGARLPSGRGNVVATYRQALGLAGRVRAGTLTTLLDRPTGVKAATNPTAADGGADPESLARARQTAPGTVRTFGRAISLRDFEDTALVAGEVAKVRADWIWTGRRRVIHLTMAGRAGATFSPAGLARLAATLDTERDPNQPLRVGNYGRVAVVVAGTIIVDDRFVAEAVLAATRAALLDALSFDRRAFSEPVDLSDVYAVLQGVPGVVAVDIDRLDLKSTDASFRKAHGVDDTKGQPQARLLMLPAQPGGVPGVILPAEIAWVEVPAFDVVLGSSGGIVQ